MTVHSVVDEVCSFVGVREPKGSIFVPSSQDRTAWEMVKLANEMAQRIAYDTREWQMLRSRCTFTGYEDAPGVLHQSWDMPADYQRMLKTAQVWRSTWTTGPLAFVSDPDDWLRHEIQNHPYFGGEWTLEGNQMLIRPALAIGETVKFYYLRNGCVRRAPPATGFNDRFLVDDDTFVLPERLLKLGMIWQWKAYKGGSYAEDIANYEDALANVQGADKPAPIIVGTQPMSSDAQVAYWGPTPNPGTFVGPGP